MQTSFFKYLAFAAFLLPASSISANHFWLGGDISGTTQLESEGIYSYNLQDEQVENTRLMKDYGMDAVRLRVWVDPKGGWSGPEDVLEMARRAKANDMDIMIDFHYSDWWADPGKQYPPKAWEGLDFEQTKKALADHTRSTLQLLKDNGIDVRWVQVGNETTNGFLWPMAQTEQGNDIDGSLKRYADLTTAGYQAVKEVYPEATAIVHLDNGYDRDLYFRTFDALRENGTPFDMIGMSVYPFWSKRDPLEYGTVADIVDNINAISARYDVPVMIVETGVDVNDPANGKIFLDRLIAWARDYTDGRCEGVFYWAPECCHGGYQLGAFANDRPTVIMDAFLEASKSSDKKQ